MHRESNANANPSAVLVPEIVPSSPWRVTGVEVLPGFRLQVAFADGLTGVVDMSGLVHSPKAGVFAALADPSRFAQAALHYGAVTWPGDLDLAPDAMHTAIQERGEWTL
jgi:hypothetical protein